MSKLVVAFLFFSVVIHAQESENNTNGSTIYYWFNISIGKSVSRETGVDQFYIRNIESSIRSGSFENFILAHKSGLHSGEIAIGPFAEESHASRAQLLYRYIGKTVPEKELGGDDATTEYTFFFIKPVAEDYTQELSFQKIPCRVTTGSLDDFMGMLDEGMGFEKIAIGPFYNYESAEKSKFVYLKNGTEPGDPEADSLKNKELRMMAKRWKDLDLSITKKSVDKESNRTIYRFSTKFSRRYFAPDAFQVISIKASYSNSSQSSSYSFTLQGDNAIDNNPSVSNAMGTTYINVLDFDMFPDTKIDGFLFESFIYNNEDLIELEPIYYEIK